MEDDGEKKRLVKRSIEDYDPNYTPKRFKRPKTTTTMPHWYNKSFLLYLALRQTTEPAAKGDLIQGAFKLNAEMGLQMKLPFLFGGKSPYSSASILLTSLSRDWVKLHDPHTRITFYKLPVPPITLEAAAETYQHWCRQLTEYDWSVYFEGDYRTNTSRLDHSAFIQSLLPPTIETTTYVPSEETSFTSLSSALQWVMSQPPPSDTTTRQEMIDRLPLAFYKRPQQWSDIVKVTNTGVFALRPIPKGVPIGFYYGAPMTEDEFDALKYRQGRSADFCLMYRRTVLDPTDRKGQPVTDITSKLFCPFHFMKEVDQLEATVLLEETKLQNQIVCWTKNDIEIGQELTAWFGKI